MEFRCRLRHQCQRLVGNCQPATGSYTGNRVRLHALQPGSPALVPQDLLVASLFRNFLLAERIMTAAGCSPVSLPRLPPTHQHPMWQVRR